MKILAIGAHPDDIEFFMFGFLSACKKRGDQIHMGIATDGAAGDIRRNDELKFTREKETLKGLKVLGRPSFLGIPDGQLSFALHSKEIIDSYIKSINPNLIITHSTNDYHPDHRALSKYVTQSAGFKCPVIYADTLMGVNFLPDIYIDITSFFIEKKKAISHHKSQRPEKFISAVSIWNGFRAAQCNAPSGSYAEAFSISKAFPFSDIRSTLPESPILRPFYSEDSDGLI